MSERTPRHHHWLPVFYVAGFTADGSSSGKVHVFDYLRDRAYWSTAKKVAKHKGQYRLDDEARDPEALEKALAHVEGQLAPALHRVRDAGKIEHKNQLPELLSLTALIHARSPRTRESLDLMIARRLKRDLLSGAMTPEQWSSIRQTELRAGVPERLMPDFNEAKRLARSGRWEPPQPRTAHREIFPQSVVWIEEILSARRWSLWRADPAKTGFICSDCPLSSLKGEPGQPGLHLAPLGDSDAMLTFPLSAHLALASLEGLTQGNHVATDLIVGDINTRTKLASTGLLYSPSREFLLRRGDRAESSLSYFEYVSQARRAGILQP